MLIFRRSNCIFAVSGIVTLCELPYSALIESGLPYSALIESGLPYSAPIDSGLPYSAPIESGLTDSDDTRN